MKKISITQGGAAVVPFNQSIQVVSTDFETCALVIYRGEKKYLAVHDSGQLDFVEIRRALEYVGAIVSIGLLVTEPHKRKHFLRLLPLLKELRLQVELRHPRALTPFHAGVDSQGKFVEISSQQRGVIHNGMPGYQAREAVAKLNDWFSPSGLVPLDLQYVDGDYTCAPQPKHSMGEMLEEMRRDDKYRTLGMAVLSHYGRQSGLAVPQLVHEFVAQHGLQQAPFGLPTIEEVAVFNLSALSTLENMHVSLCRP